MTTDWNNAEQPVGEETTSKPPVVSTASIDIDASLYAVFDIATNPDYLPKLFKSWGPVPAIECAYMEGENPMREGEVRRIVYGDGTQTDEEITILLRPLRHAYRLRWKSMLPFSGMAGNGTMDWVFTPYKGGTRVTWEADFTPNSNMVRPLVGIIAESFYQPFQRKALENLKKITEEQAKAPRKKRK